MAVHAMVYLVHKKCIVSSTALAENICTNPARVRKVMAKLHRAGLVEPHMGQKSGYTVYSNSGSVSLDTVLNAVQEQPIEMNWRSGDMEQDCLVASGMGDIMAGIYGALNKACIEKLSEITINDINDMIFGKEKKQNEV